MEALAAFGTIGMGIFLFVLVMLAILLPFSAYSAQKWANRTYQETKLTNEKLDEFLAILNNRDL